MLKRILVYLLLLIITTVVAFNFKHILELNAANGVSSQARKAIYQRNWQAAIQIYQVAAKQHADNAIIQIRLGWLYERNHQPFLAEKTYRQLLKEEPNNEEALVALMHVLEQSPDGLPAAMIMLKKAVKAHPTRTRILNAMGDFYRDIAQNSSEGLSQNQMLAQKVNPSIDNEQARDYYQASLKLDPQQYRTQFNLGLINQRMHSLQPAAYAYCKAVMMKPDSYEARYNLGLVLSDLSANAQAYRQMDQAVQILRQQGTVDVAQALSLKIQAVKTQGADNLAGQNENEPQLSFLDKGCLL